MTEPIPLQSPLVCDLTAIPAGQRASHQTLANHLLTEAALERRELPDGYAFRFHAGRFSEVVAFIGNEHLCCPFFTFQLEITPAHGPIWLRITGPEGVKALLHVA